MRKMTHKSRRSHITSMLLKENGETITNTEILNIPTEYTPPDETPKIDELLDALRKLKRGKAS